MTHHTIQKIVLLTAAALLAAGAGIAVSRAAESSSFYGPGCGGFGRAALSSYGDSAPCGRGYQSGSGWQNQSRSGWGCPAYTAGEKR